MPEEVNESGNYDQAARAARGLDPLRTSTDSVERTQSSAVSVNAWGNHDEMARSARYISPRQSPTDDFVGRGRWSAGMRRASISEHVAVQHSQPLEEGTPRKEWADYYEMTKEVSGCQPTQDNGEEKEQAPRIIDLSQTIQDNIDETFSIYFEGLHEATKKKIKPFQSTVAYFDATMPSSQPFILATFGQLKQVILFIELSLRGISQVYFQNNPLSGLLILIGLLIQSTRVGVYGLLALVSGNLTAYGLGFDSGLARSGLFGYNAMLVGLALATFDSAEKHTDYSFSIALFSVVISSFSSVLLVVFGKMLHPYKSPPLTLPFNIAAMMFLIAASNMLRLETGPVLPPSLADFDPQTIEKITASQFFAGTIRGLGQVFLADDIEAGFLVLAGICVSSRIAGAAALFGSLLGTGVAVATGAPLELVEAGLCGYNASLSVTALFTFYCPSRGTTVLAVAAGVMTVVAQKALSNLLQPFGLPVLTLPFCVIALPFIMLQGTTPIVVAIPLPQLTVPEDHLRRVRTLEEGVNFLKECLHPEEKQQYGAEISNSLRLVDSAIGSDGGIINRNDRNGDFVQIFDALKETSSKAITVKSFHQALSQSGLSDPAGRRFATFVFHLMDRNHSNSSIDKNEFIALCRVSRVVAKIRRKISEFFHFVDLNGNGWIGFEELDSSLDYLGQPALSQSEHESLMKMTGTILDSDEMEVVELINLLTVHKLKSMVVAYHNSPTDNTDESKKDKRVESPV